MRAIEGTGVAEKQLDFADELLNLYEGADPRRANWQEALARARSRLAEQRYYLAVIGEFNSGKSTFINALLETELLASSAGEATTAIVRIAYGRRFTVRVEFRDGNRWGGEGPVPGGHGRIRPVRAPDEMIGEGLSGAEIGQRLDTLELRDALRAVMTDPTVAPAIGAVHVELPAPLLASGLVLIDTPGSESAYTDERAELARRAVTDADAAVIVNQQGKILSNSLVAFLNDALDEGLRSRCVFVVTRADNAEPEELADLDTAARRRVADRLRIDPALVWSAPLHVLKAKDGDPGADRIWAERFDLTRAWLRRIAETRRPAAVADTALRVVADVLAELEEDLGRSVADLEHRRGELEATAPADMDELLSRQVRAGLEDLHEQSRELRAALPEAAEQTVRTVREQMEEAVSGISNDSVLRRVFDEDVPPRAAATVQAFADQWLTTINNRFTASLESASSHLDAAFSTAYDQLRRIGPVSGDPLDTAGAHSGSLGIRLAGDSFSETQRFLSDNSRRDTVSLGGGAGAGALIGTLILPGVGTVVGGLVGVLASNAFFVRDTETVRREAVDRAIGPVRERVDSLRTHLLSAITACCGRAEAELRLRAQRYRDTYASNVEKLHEGHRLEQERLRDRGRRLAQGRSRALARGAEVQEERTRLRRAAALTTTDPFGGFDD
ncbi:dynamin family protein [Nocardiopsis valliformis]|uniref:dynamin family protein n=1 Tax=Nocardiopsis valliformis TaxID=239974 RepID=UPI00034D44D6|nr:dynamin family protein [Nocardiopsis valliformis]